ncbi:hypothetical protein GCM10020001_034950 [Nonomuraea salmonea]
MLNRRKAAPGKDLCSCHEHTQPPVQAIRAETGTLFTEGRDVVEVIEAVAPLGARLIIQTAVEAEVDALLGRSRYQRTAIGSHEEALMRPG